MWLQSKRPALPSIMKSLLSNINKEIGVKRIFLLFTPFVFNLFFSSVMAAECEKTVSCCLSDIPSQILSAQNPKGIIYKPIQFGRTRVKLTRQYACQHYGICQKSIV